MSKLRVLRLIARMNVGGPALQVTGLVKGLDTSEFETLLVTGEVEAGEADFLELRGTELPVVRIPALGRSIRPTDDLEAFWRTVREIRRFDPHIVHTHTAKAGVLGRLAAKICRVPFTVHTFHGHLLHGYFSPLGTWAVRQTERLLALGTDRLLSVGSQVRDELLQAGVGSPEQYVIMPPGIPAPSTYDATAARLELGLKADDLVVSFVARLTDVKRPDRLIDVAERVIREEPRARFVVAGEGPLFEETKMAAAPLADRILFLGWTRDVGRVYSASDVTILTSDNEGMPVSLIEAAMCHVPAVATDVGSVREVVQHGRTGLVTTRAPSEIASATIQLLGNAPLRASFAKAAQAHASESFSTDRLVADTTSVYRSLLEGDPGTARHSPT